MAADLQSPPSRQRSETATAKLAFAAGVLGKIVGAQETDLLERPSAVSTAKVAGNSVTVAVPARGITTVLIKLARGA